jgi:hypothetical protein
MSLEDFIERERPKVDWRLPEHRLEAFSRICHVRMIEGDLDHHHVSNVISDSMNLDNDSKVLYALLFGQSYRNHWAMIALQLFPDLLTYDSGKFQAWHDDNWQRLKFAKDTKWGLRKVPGFVESIKNRVGSAGLFEHFGNIANSGTTEQNYNRLNEELKSLFGIGRMTAWLAQQTLYELFGWDIDHWDQQLYDTSGTWSQFGALTYVFNRPDLAAKKGKLDKSDIREMEDATQVLMEYCNEHIPFHVDIYNVESCECEFRKTAAKDNPKEFTGWTSNELVEQYSELKALWNDYATKIDWNPYITGFMTKGKNIRNYGWSKEYFRVYKDYGYNLNTHWWYKDEPDAHEVLELPKIVSPGVKEMLIDWSQISDHTKLETKYNPVNYLRFKSKDHPAWSKEEVDYSYAP